MGMVFPQKQPFYTVSGPLPDMVAQDQLQMLIASFHPLERAVVPYLTKAKDPSTLATAAQLQEIEVMRALQWLADKKLLTLSSSTQEVVTLGTVGLSAVTAGLPERRLLQTLATQAAPLSALARESALSHEEVNVSIGLLRRQNLIVMTKQGDVVSVSLSPEGRKMLTGKFPQEKFITQTFPLAKDSLTKEQQVILADLLKRKDIVRVDVKKSYTYQLTLLGKEVTERGIHDLANVVDQITPQLLTTGEWKGKSFRRLNITTPVGPARAGKKHIVTESVDRAKRIWLDLGFEEITGNLVQTSFWNFDALFTAQDHPVREMHDTFFLKSPAKGVAPSKEITKRVKEMHETGGASGSKGWGGEWSVEESRRNVLRTHTTVLTAHTLAKLQSKGPNKFFAIGKCFRNEALDWNHLFEFNQTEGIVIDPNANFTHLLGYLKQFFAKMGFPEARFRPAFFPYTEPSIEIDVFHPVKQEWVELGGAGMARPEVAVALVGKDIPILMWGPGFDRILRDYHKIADLRDLYRNNLSQLRTWKLWKD